MAVLVEGISVLLKTRSIHEKFGGGWEAFAAAVPNRSLCSDGELTRVGFLHPSEVQAFCAVLEEQGLRYSKDGEADDFVLADQVHGLSLPCAWAQFGHAEVPGGLVAAARLTGSAIEGIVAPPGWSYAGSLSSRVDVLTEEGLARKYRFLRRENGQEVYLNLVTGKEMFLTRGDGAQEPGMPVERSTSTH